MFPEFFTGQGEGIPLCIVDFHVTGVSYDNSISQKLENLEKSFLSRKSLTDVYSTREVQVAIMVQRLLLRWSLFTLCRLLTTYAYWRMACSVSQTARIDPILNPGAVSGHVHKFSGGNSGCGLLSTRSC